MTEPIEYTDSYGEFRSEDLERQLKYLTGLYRREQDTMREVMAQHDPLRQWYLRHGLTSIRAAMEGIATALLTASKQDSLTCGGITYRRWSTVSITNPDVAVAWCTTKPSRHHFLYASTELERVAREEQWNDAELEQAGLSRRSHVTSAEEDDDD